MKLTVEQINALLPQTQCGDCDYAGCKPYAKAIIEQGEHIDRCLPGGVATLLKLAQITQQDATPYLDNMQQKQKPPSTAIIRENECIGCTKCIQACPVDAILGSAKQMHTVISDECTGCELCVEPCPVDCIDIIPLKTTKYKVDIAKKRYEFRNLRLQKEQAAKKAKHTKAKFKTPQQAEREKVITARKEEIAAIMKRVKAKR